MKITSVEGLPIRIPQRSYMGGHAAAAHGRRLGNYVKHEFYRSIYSLNCEAFLVKITTDDGLVGWGEAQCAIAPDVLQMILNELIAPFLMGQDAAEIATLRDGAYDLMRERGHDGGFFNDVIAGCDIALWDIAGKAAGKPVYQLLGEARRDDLPCYVSGVPAADAREQIEKMRQWLDEGFHAFKISLGGGVEAHVERMRQLREALGDRIDLMIDAHWAFDLPGAVRLAQELAPYDIQFLECPLIPEDIDGLAELTASVDMPIALGEEYRTRFHFKERLARGALNIAQPDVGRLGVTEMQRVIALCDAFAVPVAPHLGTGLALYTAASLHVAAAMPNFHVLEFQPTQMAVSDEYFAPSLRPTAGRYALPPGPGLGVVPSEERLREHLLAG